MTPYLIAYGPLALLVAALGLRLAYEFRVGAAPAYANTGASSRAGSGMERRARKPAARPTRLGAGALSSFKAVLRGDATVGRAAAEQESRTPAPLCAPHRDFDLTTELEAIEFDWPKRPTGPYGES